MLQTLKNLPQKPGVYQFYDSSGKLLYVGKAKNLSKRVKSYFRLHPKLIPSPTLGVRQKIMVSNTVKIETIVTANESDALLLENSLIKQLKPKYNILLRDDKTYPYIYIDLNKPFARLEITRKVVKGKKIKYFGPFTMGAKDILDSIYELVPLVQKKSCLKSKKACLFYQIDRCKAPCEGKISQDNYSLYVNEAISLIHNKKRLIDKLCEKMEFYSTNLRFEEAAQIRDRIEKIKKLSNLPAVDVAKVKDLDVFAVDYNNEQGVVVKLFMREGKVVSSTYTTFKAYKEIDLSEVYRRSLVEFYNQDIPFTATEILTAHPIKESDELCKFLSKKAGKKIDIKYPIKGSKKRVVDLALQNATEILKLQKDSLRNDISLKVAELLKLKEEPRRVEIFDNSHIMGEAPVGAMVVFSDGKWIKSDYRSYNLAYKDEYSQMRQMLKKRADSFSKNPPPDLWVIDGGEALRVLAEKILKESKVDLPVVAISKEKIDSKAHRAKGAAKDILYTPNGVLKLLPSDPRLHWFQRLRDEAHRFALKLHKKRRAKENKELSLFEIKGIGPAKVKKLINFFGSFEAIKNSDIKTLESVLSKNDAKNLFEYFKNNQ